MAVYKNPNCRLLYLHLALKAGYHDDDRDICDLSLREMSWQTGLTLSAVRHALKVLSNAHLVESQNGIWIVKKWIEEKPITARKKKEIQGKIEQSIKQRRTEEKAADERREKEAAYWREQYAQGKSSLDIYLESLQKRADDGDTDAAERLKKYKQKSI